MRKVLLTPQVASVLLGTTEADVLSTIEQGLLRTEIDDLGFVMVALDDLPQVAMDQEILQAIREVALHPERGMPIPVDQDIVH